MRTRCYLNLVDQPEYGKNTSYLTDFIQITYYAKLINLEQIRDFYLNDGLSAAQIARQLGVAKSSILARLHSLGIREGVRAGRSTSPKNFRSPVAPYGYEVREGKLVASKAELRICRTVVDLIVQKGFSANAVAKELGRLGLKSRSGEAVWHHGTVISICKRWKGKI